VVEPGDTDVEKVPLPAPVTVPPPLLRVSVQAPVAVTTPAIVAAFPLQIVDAVLKICPCGLWFTVTAAVPARSPASAMQFASEKEATAYVVVETGETDFEKLPEPVPVTVPPLLFNTSVHAPVAVTVPAIVVLLPLQMVTDPLVIEALGL
jgi:hypothetical protein